MASTTNLTERQTLLIIALLVTVLFVILLSPMRSILVWSSALAVIFAPLNERMAKSLDNRNWSSLITVMASVVIVMIPLLAIIYISKEQLSELSNQLSLIANHFSDYTHVFENFINTNFGINADISSIAKNGKGEFINSVQTLVSDKAVSVGGAAVSITISIISTLYIMYFFLRDWRSILNFIGALIPLSQSNKDALSAEMISVINATIRGTIIVAAIQAGAAGIFYFMLGVDAWAVLTAATFLFCLVPAVGAGAVWLPLSLYFLITGQVAEFWIMILGGFFVIGMIDNFLKPRLIGRETDLPAFLIFLTSFGGLFLIGIDGLLIGPVAAKLFIVVWTLYTREFVPDNDLDEVRKAGIVSGSEDSLH